MKAHIKLLLLICTIGVGLLLFSGQVLAADCSAPEQLTPITDSNGVTRLNWRPVSGSLSCKIEVKTLDGSVVLTYNNVPGNYTSMTIPDADLQCGDYTWTISCSCCLDGCDNCDFDVPADQTWCEVANEAYPNPCFCADPLRDPWGEIDNPYYPSPWYFQLRDRDGAIIPEGSPELIYGCSWGCKDQDMTQTADPEMCGVDYEFTCGRGPHERIIGVVPSYDLCAVNDGKSWKYISAYWEEAVYNIIPFPQDGLYTWNCLQDKNDADGNDESNCYSCRRAECGDAFGGEYTLEDLAKLTPKDLCGPMEFAGDFLKTGLPLSSSLDGTVSWQCVGSSKCNFNGIVNHNAVMDSSHVVFDEYGFKTTVTGQWNYLDACTASLATCGTASDNGGGFYTAENFGKKSGLLLPGGVFSEEIGFLCSGNGVAKFTEDSFFVGEEGMFSYRRGWTWDCEYPSGSVVRGCHANEVYCNQPEGESWTEFTKTGIEDFFEGNDYFCKNGKTEYLLSGVDGVSLLLGNPYKDDVTKNGTHDHWLWQCTDKDNVKTDVCAVPLVACEIPPTGKYYVSTEELESDGPHCTGGTMVELGESNSGGFVWGCVDSFKNVKSCTALSQSCARPHGETVSSYDDIENIEGVEFVSDYPKTYKGLCADKDLEVAVTINDAGDKYEWKCLGQTNSQAYAIDCFASKVVCEKPLDGGYYMNWTHFIDETMSIGDVTCYDYKDIDGLVNNRDDATSASCNNVCSSSAVNSVVVNRDDNGNFVWDCGTDSCLANLAGCNPAVNNVGRTYSDFTPCMNGGTQIAYNNLKTYTQGGWETDNLFVAYGQGTPSFYDVNKNMLNYNNIKYAEGSWLWRCEYPGGLILPKVTTSTEDQKYWTEGDYDSDVTLYCSGWEFGECGNIADGSVNLSELKARASNDNERGHRDLCNRGIVQKSDWTDSGQPFDDGFSCENGVCSWWCEGGSGNDTKHDPTTPNDPQHHAHNLCSVEVKGCGIPPHGETRTEAAMNALPETKIEDNKFKALCEDGVTWAEITENASDHYWTWTCAGDSCYADRTCEPSVTIAPTTDKVCKDGDDIEYTATVLDCSSSNTVYNWTVSGAGQKTVGDCGSSDNTCFIETLDNDETSYIVSVSVTCNDLCAKNNPYLSNSVTVEIGHPEVGLNCSFSDCTVCSGKNIDLTANTTSCTSPSYTWYGVLSEKSGNPVSYNKINDGDTPMTYTGGVKVTCDGCSSEVVNKTITVKPYGEISGLSILPLTPRTMCINETQDLSTYASCSNGDTFLTWTNAVQDPTPASAKFTPTTKGTTTVVLTVECTGDDICTKKDTAEAVFNVKEPVVEITTATTTICSVNDKTLSATNNGSCSSPTYTWYYSYNNGEEVQFGEGDSPIFNEMHDYEEGDYGITVKMTCGDCIGKDDVKSTDTVNITVTESKIIEITKLDIANEPARVCQGTDFEFDIAHNCNESGETATYEWSVGSNTFSSLTELNEYFRSNNSFGLYTVGLKLTCTNGECIEAPGVATKDVSIFIKQNKDFSVNLGDDLAICVDENIDITSVVSSVCAGVPADAVAYEWGDAQGTYNLGQINKTYSNFSKSVAGVYSLYVRATCAENNCCYKPNPDIDDVQITVKETDPNASITADTNNFCTDNDIILTASDDCNNAEYTWSGGPTIGIANGNVFTISSPIDEGEHTYEVIVDCDASECPNPNPVSATTTFNVNKSIELIASVTGTFDERICESDKNVYTLQGETNCSDEDAKYTWFINGVEQINEDGDNLKIVPEGLDPGDYVVTFQVDCDNSCADKDSTTGTADFTIVGDFVPIVNITTTDNSLEFCMGEDIVLTTVDNCKNPTYVWNPGSLTEKKLLVDSSVAGVFDYMVLVTCSNDECPNPISEEAEVTITINDCSCGPANLGDYTQASWGGVFRPDLCNDGGIIGGPENTSYGWSWSCKYGDTLVTGCSADLVECGDNDEDYFTEGGYDSQGDCTAVNATGWSKVCLNDDPNCYYSDYYNAWTWDCVDDIGGVLGTLTCGAYKVGCGIADADEAVSAGVGLFQDVYDSNGVGGDDLDKEGSYNERAELSGDYAWKTCGQPTDSGIIASFLGDDGNNGKGKWQWECSYEDEAGRITTETCKARDNCVDADNNAPCHGDNCFETVEYVGTSQCWTAEDVSPAGGDGNFKYNYEVATQLSTWDSCRSRKLCESDLANDYQGACPDNWHIPSANPTVNGRGAWPLLENYLSGSSTCAVDRFNTASCSGAGSITDGLRDWVTFDADSGDEFWTRNYSGYGRDVACTKDGYRKCDKSPVYYTISSFNNSIFRSWNNYNYDEDGRGFYLSWEHESNEHYLRCIKDASSGDAPIIQPGEEEDDGSSTDEPCTGFGCLFF